MASNQANTGISLNEQASFAASGKQVPAALSMMVDSMQSMWEKAEYSFTVAFYGAARPFDDIL